MLQLRPTFSESWYRVVTLKPKLRGTAQISRQYYRGERWYVVRDAASNQFHRLSDAAYRFVGLLDGSRTVGEAWDLVGGQLADDAPTQPEVIQILSQLYAANLVETDITPDATVLLRRHKKQMQRKLQGRMMNVLFPRIPVWDPDRFLCRWMPAVRPLLSKLGSILWLVLVVFAISLLIPEWSRLKSAAADSIAPSNWFYLWIVFVAVKFIHECGHAFACRRFGGEVHEMGIMFLVFIPTPYVDASTAWAFPNKWARMFVGAAGMIIELFVASLCAIFWVFATPNTLPSQLAYNAMFIASVSTVIFNANPLLRYDGYYILSDFLEIPNLQMRSREYLLGLIKRYVFRIKASQPLPPTGQCVLLFVYGILSTCYRIFVGVMIILVVTWKVPILGVLMGIGGVVTWVVVPIVKLFKYLVLEPELHRKRGRAWAFSGAVAAAVILLIGIIPFPVNVYASAIIEPEKEEVLHSTTPGWVKEIRAHDGDKLHAGDIIAICDDPNLDVRIVQMQAHMEEVKIRMLHSSVHDIAQMHIDQIELDATQQQLAENVRKQKELTITSPIDGYLIAPELHNLQDRFLERGKEIATVATMDTLLAKATIEQRDAELAYAANDTRTEIRLIGRPDVVLHATKMIVFDAAQKELPHASIGQAGGGEIAMDPHDPSGKKPLVEQFELRATLSNPQAIYCPGQGASVRIKLDKRPLLWQWTRKLLQMIQSQNDKWL
jgi:putative peptide zinc metalloprotease protein